VRSQSGDEVRPGAVFCGARQGPVTHPLLGKAAHQLHCGGSFSGCEGCAAEPHSGEERGRTGEVGTRTGAREAGKGRLRTMVHGGELGRVHLDVFGPKLGLGCLLRKSAGANGRMTAVHPPRSGLVGKCRGGQRLRGERRAVGHVDFWTVSHLKTTVGM
jgi:hypothetical protein